ncbi:MAG: amidohydrolase [Herpetosiphon sp.]
MTLFVQEAEALHAELVEMRRDLHAHPELGFLETRTARIVAEHLGALGYEVVRGVGKTGIIGVLTGAQPGERTVLLRFDMDALPIQEENDVPYRSQTAGVMHACGHDAHVAVGLGVAKLLAQHQAEFPGTVKLMFQPAEEILRGAEAMIADGILEQPHVDVALALHVLSQAPLGTAVVHSGPLGAGADLFEIVVRGRGGHGALPHETIDSVVVAAHIIVALQSIMSRNVNPEETGVVTIGRIHGGQAGNVIADTVTLSGTIRSFNREVHLLIRRRIEELVTGVATAFGAQADLTLTIAVEPTINAAGPSTVVARVAGEVLGVQQIDTTSRSMGSEDFSAVLAQVPGTFFFLGAGNAALGLNHPHHSPHFDIDEACLPAGVAILCEAAVRCLRGEDERDR